MSRDLASRAVHPHSLEPLLGGDGAGDLGEGGAGEGCVGGGMLKTTM